MRRGRRAAAQISFKEPSLRDKMRQVPKQPKIEHSVLKFNKLPKQRDGCPSRGMGPQEEGWVPKKRAGCPRRGLGAQEEGLVPK